MSLLLIDNCPHMFCRCSCHWHRTITAMFSVSFVQVIALLLLLLLFLGARCFRFCCCSLLLLLMLPQGLESISQQIRFHFGLKSCELPLIFDSQTSNEGTWCTRTLTIDHAKAALPQGQEFDIKVLSIGRLLKVCQLCIQELQAVAVLQSRCTLLLSESALFAKFTNSDHILHACHYLDDPDEPSLSFTSSHVMHHHTLNSMLLTKGHLRLTDAEEPALVVVEHQRKPTVQHACLHS